jgi:zinc protease
MSGVGVSAGWVRTEVDGVPVYWEDAAGPLRAALVFRVGQVDEPLARRGLTHLVEHLALVAEDPSSGHVNGGVDATTTAFEVRGSAERVTTFLGNVCRALRELPVERIPLENQVLRTEAAGRDTGLVGALLVWRYGATGPGVVGFDELGIGQHSATEVRRWAAHRFTRGNAVLWLVGGPPPADLRLDLPDGPRIGLPPAPPPLLPLPGYLTTSTDGVGLCGVVERSWAGTAAATLLRRRLFRTLRAERAVSYSPSASYQPRDRTTAHVFALADGLSSAHDELVSGFAEVLDSLAENPATATELAEIRAGLAEPLREPGAGRGTVAAALAELTGVRPQQYAEAESEIADLTAEAVRAAGWALRESALLALPVGRRPPGNRYRRAPHGSGGTVDGQVLLPVGGSTGAERRLVIGTRGVTWVRQLVFHTVHFNRCVAVLAWPDGARRLIDSDGTTVHIEPNLWAGAQGLPGWLDTAVPPGLVLRQPARAAGAIPATPQPAPAAAPVTRRSLFRRS